MARKTVRGIQRNRNENERKNHHQLLLQVTVYIYLMTQQIDYINELYFLFKFNSRASVWWIEMVYATPL